MDIAPHERTYAETARRTGKKNTTTIQEWSRTHQWIERANAWDAHITRVGRQEIERRVQELARARVDAAFAIISRGQQDLPKIDRTLTPFEIARLTEVATKLGDVGAGQGDGGGIKFENVLIAIAEQRKDPRTVTD